MANIIEEVVVPEVPKVIDKQELFVYVPEAADGQKGIASFDSEAFSVINGKVYLKVEYIDKLNDDALSDIAKLKVYTKQILQNLISTKLTVSADTQATITDKATLIDVFNYTIGTYTISYEYLTGTWTDGTNYKSDTSYWGITVTEYDAYSTITVVLALYGNNNLATENYVDGQISTVNTAITGLQGDITALTVTQESCTIATTDWTALADSEPFTYSATITATHTIGTNTEVGIINDQPVLFANYGFVVGAISGQSVTIYTTELPTASVTLVITFKG